MDAVGIDEVTAESMEEERKAVSEEKGLPDAREDETGRKQERAVGRQGLATAHTVHFPVSMARRLAEKKELAQSALAAAAPPMPQRQAIAAEL